MRARRQTYTPAPRRHRHHPRPGLHRPTHAPGLQSPRPHPPQPPEIAEPRNRNIVGAIPCGRPIYGIDLIPERLQLASDLGADDAFLAPSDEQALQHLLAPYTEGCGADAIIITAAGVRPFKQAVAAVRKGGMIHIFAAHSAMVPINLETIYQQEVVITSTYSSSPEDLRIALALLDSRKVRVDGLISHRLPLDHFAEGVALMQKHAALKVYFQIAGES